RHATNSENCKKKSNNPNQHICTLLSPAVLEQGIFVYRAILSNFKQKVVYCWWNDKCSALRFF
ncbi:MAG: hypothetical protein KDD53_12905, partial [Bdellovibrionales bacterium]|nr:hypothetical protein [Bdellovibrionales bacterium]